MRRFACNHHLQVSDTNTIELLHFAGKLRYKQYNDSYGSLAAKTAKDNGASENYVERETVEKLTKTGGVVEETDGSWMIVEMANDKVQDGIQRWQQVPLKLKLRDDGYAYTGWFTVYDMKEFDSIIWMHWVRDINGTYHIDHWTNEIWITQVNISWDDRENAA